MIQPMAIKNYSEEFRRQAVDLYESTPGATIKDIAADLGISRGTLTFWLRKLGTDATPSQAAPTGSTAPASPARSSRTPRPTTTTRVEPPMARIAQLEARVAELEAEQTKLATERDILRQAAKYFAGETNW